MQLLKNNITFIHIPKTGGTFIRSVFNKIGVVEKDYTTSKGVKNCKTFENIISCHMVPTQSRHYTFAFIRNPITWYESYYNFRVGKHKKHKRLPGEKLVCNAFKESVSDNYNINTFVKYLYRNNYPYYTLQFRFYNPYISEYFYFENLKKDLIKLVKSKLNIELDESILKKK